MKAEFTNQTQCNNTTKTEDEKNNAVASRRTNRPFPCTKATNILIDLFIRNVNETQKTKKELSKELRLGLTTLSRIFAGIRVSIESACQLYSQPYTAAWMIPDKALKMLLAIQNEVLPEGVPRLMFIAVPAEEQTPDDIPMPLPKFMRCYREERLGYSPYKVCCTLEYCYETQLTAIEEKNCSGVGIGIIIRVFHYYVSDPKGADPNSIGKEWATFFTSMFRHLFKHTRIKFIYKPSTLE